MYKHNRINKTTLKRNKGYAGETLEQKINRIVNNKEPIKDGAPLIYQERKEGINPDYDIRTDRMEVAVEAMDKVARAHHAKRDNRIGKLAKDGMKKEEKTDKDITGGESIRTTNE